MAENTFYLGREYDASKQQLLEPVRYDAKNLTTHAVCVGMTGSGKTGLCVALLEETALSGVPVIVIDPKGDMTNLLLTFPELGPSDFEPWVNGDAQGTATKWKDGLGEDLDRLRRLKDSADFTIYTPGSGAGVPVSILSSFAAPKLDWEEHEEALRDKVRGTVSALLGLVGIEADPVNSREHILLANIIERAWRDGRDLDLNAIIGLVQNPQMQRLGVFDLDTFFPDRFDLASRLNNLIAAPGFERWTDGQPLDIDALYAKSGKPQVSIFYISHLSDAERMFFVTLLLEQVLTWARDQPGIADLRALLYMDETFGFFPPVAEPPSKRPLLTLLKQARAAGLGVVLSTQNPVDLDYKGLTNAGTWFIGKLQAERDKARLLEGLEGAGADRQSLDRLISSLSSRVFLLHSIYQPPRIFHTRWTMSYLAGPLSRQQVGLLMRDRKSAKTPSVNLRTSPPALPPGMKQTYIRTDAQSGQVVYRPRGLVMGQVSFLDRKLGIDETRRVALLLEAGEEAVEVSMPDLADAPLPGALFDELPSGLELTAGILDRQTLVLSTNRTLALKSKPGESDFAGRSRAAAKQACDTEVNTIAAKYARKLTSVHEQLTRKEQQVRTGDAKYQTRKREELLSVGESLLATFLGHNRPLSMAVRQHGITVGMRAGVGKDRAEANRLRDGIAKLEAEQCDKAEEVARKWEAVAGDIETVRLTPRRIRVELVALAWTPFWEGGDHVQN